MVYTKMIMKFILNSRFMYLINLYILIKVRYEYIQYIHYIYAQNRKFNKDGKVYLFSNLCLITSR